MVWICRTFCFGSSVFLACFSFVRDVSSKLVALYMKDHCKRYFIKFACFGLPGWPQTGHLNLISTISQNQSVPQRLFHKLCLIVIFLLLETNTLSAMWRTGLVNKVLKNKKRAVLDFLGGPVVGSLPVNAGGMGSIPGPGESHMLRSS